MAKVLPMRTVLRFLQIERQVDRLVSLKIMAETPLVPKEHPRRNQKPKQKINPDEMQPQGDGIKIPGFIEEIAGVE